MGTESVRRARLQPDRPSFVRSQTESPFMVPGFSRADSDRADCTRRWRYADSCVACVACVASSSQESEPRRDADALAPGQPLLQLLHVDVEHRRHVEREHLRDDADRRPPRGRAGAGLRRRRPSRARSAACPSSAAIVVIMIGRKRTMQASWIASVGAVSARARASRAKSIIMIAFFLTRPTSMMTPTKA